MSENTQQKACISCGKHIDLNADFCSFCGAPQKKPEKKLPSQFQLFMLNLICPGAGAWRLDHKGRAAIIFLIVVGALVVYCMEITPLIQKAVNTAVRTGNTNVLNGLEKQIGSNGWIHVFTIGYILSFIDSFLLRRKMNDIEKES